MGGRGSKGHSSNRGARGSSSGGSAGAAVGRADAAGQGAASTASVIQAQLAKMSTRAEAAEYLDQLAPSKAALLAAARELDIAVYDRDTVPDLKNVLIHATVGAREDAEAIQNWRDPNTIQAEPAPVVPAFSENPRKPNTWGGLQEDGAHTFHPDGAIGGLIGQPETVDLHPQPSSIPHKELALEVRGDSLENVLGNLATETMAGRMSPQQQLDELKAIAAELPTGKAKSAIGRVVEDLDVPRIDLGQRLTPEAQTALTRFPALRTLLDDLNEIPLARGGYIPGDEPDTREIDRISDALDRFGRAELGGMRFISAIESADNIRHESREGKAAIDRAVQKALRELTAQQKADRNTFYPSNPQ